MRACPFCAEEIQDAAILCRYCGTDLQTGLRPAAAAAAPIVVQQQMTGPSPGAAAFLSFIVPGLGQMCCGSVLSGIGWLVFTVIGYIAFVVPGLILHLICIISASSLASSRRMAFVAGPAATVSVAATTLPTPIVSGELHAGLEPVPSGPSPISGGGAVIVVLLLIALAVALYVHSTGGAPMLARP